MSATELQANVSQLLHSNPDIAEAVSQASFITRLSVISDCKLYDCLIYVQILFLQTYCCYSDSKVVARDSKVVARVTGRLLLQCQ